MDQLKAGQQMEATQSSLAAWTRRIPAAAHGGGCDNRRTAQVGFEGSFQCCATCQLARSSSACRMYASPSTAQAISCTAGLLTVSLSHASRTCKLHSKTMDTAMPMHAAMRGQKDMFSLLPGSSHDVQAGNHRFAALLGGKLQTASLLAFS